MMINIGMIGEYPTDIDSIVNLMNKKYSQKVRFFPLVYDVHGSNLDNPKIKHQLRREYQLARPDFVLFVRDLDGLEHSQELIDLRKRNFADFNTVVDKKGILLLNIFELEALLLSNTEVLNAFYGVQIDQIEDCMKIESPKEFIKTKTSKYSTGHNPQLFLMLDYNKVLECCRYFKRFDDYFCACLKNQN